MGEKAHPDWQPFQPKAGSAWRLDLSFPFAGLAGLALGFCALRFLASKDGQRRRQAPDGERRPDFTFETAGLSFSATSRSGSGGTPPGKVLRQQWLPSGALHVRVHALEPCSYGFTYAGYETSGDTLVLHYSVEQRRSDVPPPACVCPWHLDYVIAGVAPGDWKIKVPRQE